MSDKGLVRNKEFDDGDIHHVHDSVHDDKNVVLEEVRKDGMKLSIASLKLRSDKEVVLEAVSQNGLSLRFASSELKKDREIVNEAVLNDVNSLEFASEGLKKEFNILDGETKDEFDGFDDWSTTGSTTNKEKVENSTTVNIEKKVEVDAFDGFGDNDDVFAEFDSPRVEVKITDKVALLEAVKIDGLKLKEGSDDLKDDMEIVLASIKQNPKSLLHASDNLKSNKEVVLSAVRLDGMVLEFASEKLRNETMVVFEAVRQTKLAIQFAGQRFKDDFGDDDGDDDADEDFEKFTKTLTPTPSRRSSNSVPKRNTRSPSLVLQKRNVKLRNSLAINDRTVLRQQFLEAIKKEDKSVKLQSQMGRYCDDREIVLEAVKHDGNALFHASRRLRNEKDVVLESVKHFGWSLVYSSDELKKDKEVVLVAVRQYGKAIRHALLFLDDKEVVLEAVRQNGSVLKDMRAKMKNDPEIVLEAVKQDEKNFEHCGKELLNDSEFFVRLVKQNGMLLQHAGPEVRNNRDVVFAAVTNVVDSFQFASEELKSNIEVLTYVMSNIRKVVLRKVKENGDYLSYAGEEFEDFKNDKEVIMESVKQNGTFLRHAHEDMKGDQEVVLEAMKQDSSSLQYASMKLRNDPDFVRTAFDIDENSLRFIGKELREDKAFILEGMKNRSGNFFKVAGKKIRNDKDMCLEAIKLDIGLLKSCGERMKIEKDFSILVVRVDGMALADTRFRSNAEVVLEAVKQNGLALQFSSAALRTNEDIVLAAVKQNGLALEFASLTMKGDDLIVMEAVKNHEKALEFASENFALTPSYKMLELCKKEEFNLDKEMMIETVSSVGWTLRYANMENRSDKDIVLEAVARDGEALQFASEDLRNNQEIVEEAVQQNGLALRYASEEFRGNKQLVEMAVKENGLALRFASEEVKNDEKVVIEAVKKDQKAMQHASERIRNDGEFFESSIRRRYVKDLEFAADKLKNDKEFIMRIIGSGAFPLSGVSKLFKKDKDVVLAAMKSRGGSELRSASRGIKNDKEMVLQAIQLDGKSFKFASDTLKNDKELVLSAISNGWAFRNIKNEVMKNDREVVLQAVKTDGLAIRDIPEQFRKDEQIVLAAVEQNGLALFYSGDRFKNTKRFVLKAVKLSKWSLRYVSDSLKNDKEVAMEAVKKNGMAIDFVSDQLKNDRDICVEAIRQNGLAIQYVSKERKDDIEVALEAVKADGSFIEHVSRRLKNDEDVVLQSVKLHHESLLYVNASKFRNNKEFLLKAVKVNGFCIQHSKSALKGDKEVALVSVEQDGMVLQFINPQLRNKDKDVITAAVQQNGLALQFTSEEFRKDKEIVVLAVKQNGLAIEYADEMYKSDGGIVLQAVKQNGCALKFSSPDLRKLRQLCLIAVQSNGMSLEFTAEEFKNDKELVLDAVEQNGTSFKFCGKELKSDRAFLRKVMKCDAKSALLYASDELRNDREIVLEAVALNGDSLACISDQPVLKDLEFVSLLVSKDGLLVEHLCEELRKDKKIACIALKENVDSRKFFNKDVNVWINDVGGDLDILESALEGYTKKIKMIEEVGAEYEGFADYFYERALVLHSLMMPRKAVHNLILHYQKYLNLQHRSVLDIPLRCMNLLKVCLREILRSSHMSFKEDCLKEISESDWMDEELSKLLISKEKWEKKSLSHITTTAVGSIFRRIEEKMLVKVSNVVYRNQTFEYSDIISESAMNEFDLVLQVVLVGFMTEIAGGCFEALPVAQEDQVGGAQDSQPQEEEEETEGESIVNTVLQSIGFRVLETGKRYGYHLEFTDVQTGFVKRKIMYKSVFYGQFKDGVRHGLNCKEFSPANNGKISWEGQYREGQRSGKGVEYIYSPSLESVVAVYEGNYEHGKRNGEGVTHDPKSGKVRQVEWKNGKVWNVIFEYECPLITYSSLEKHLHNSRIMATGSFGVLYVMPTSVFSSLKGLKDKLPENFKKNVAVKIMRTPNTHVKDRLFRITRRWIGLCNTFSSPHILKSHGIIIGANTVGYVRTLTDTSIDKLIRDHERSVIFEPTAGSGSTSSSSSTSQTTTTSTATSSSSGSIGVLDTNRTKFGIVEKRRIIYETSLGMRALHSKGVLHRDLKWGNVMRGFDSVIKVTDFDMLREDEIEVWRMISSGGTNQSMNRTPGSLAPEVFLGSSYTAECDVFAFGIMFYALLFGLQNAYSTQTRCSCGAQLGNIILINNLDYHVANCNLRPKVDEKMIQKDKIQYPLLLIELMIECWDKNPFNRPSFEDICHRLLIEMRKGFTSITLRFASPKEQHRLNDRKIFLCHPYQLSKIREFVEKKYVGSKVVSLRTKPNSGLIKTDDDLCKRLLEMTSSNESHLLHIELNTISDEIVEADKTVDLKNVALTEEEFEKVKKERDGYKFEMEELRSLNENLSMKYQKLEEEKKKLELEMNKWKNLYKESVPKKEGEETEGEEEGVFNEF